MRASLIPLDGGPALEIVRDITLVGRKKFCDIQLDHPSVSKVHLVIVRTDGLLLIRDLGSTNGTKVNGQLVRRGALLPNDKLSIAGCKFRVQMTGISSDAQAAAAPGSEAEPGSGGLVARVIRADAPLCEPEEERSLLEEALLETDQEDDDSQFQAEANSVELPHLPLDSDDILPRLDD